MLSPERYEGEHDDLREEYARDEYDRETEQIRLEAGCNDECPPDCDCVEEYLNEQRARKDEERDFYDSRGVS